MQNAINTVDVCVILRISMYEDKKERQAHLKDFKRVLERVEKEPNPNEYRVRVIKECIRRCED